jgi:para-nitrobenzyl esterase
MRPSLWPDLRDADGRDLAFGGRFVAVHGDDVVPERAGDALQRGAGKDIDFMIGTTTEEANLFFVPGRAGDRLKRWQVWLLMRRVVPKARQLLRCYGFNQRGISAGVVLARTMTDVLFRAMSRRSAELHHGRSWVFEFDWRSPALGGKLGAAHAVELPFVFDMLAAASGSEGLLGLDPPQALANSIHALWIRFATEGSLPWPEYDPSSRMVYSLTRASAQHEPTIPAAAFLP